MHFARGRSSVWAIECTKIARFSAVAAAIFTAPPQNRAIFKAPRCAISSAKKIASERRFSLRLRGTNLIPTAEFPAIAESAAKIASERRCAILVHSDGPLSLNLETCRSPSLLTGSDLTVESLEGMEAENLAAVEDSMRFCCHIYYQEKVWVSIKFLSAKFAFPPPPPKGPK